MPITENGIVPGIILDLTAIWRRSTIGLLKEIM